MIRRSNFAPVIKPQVLNDRIDCYLGAGQSLGVEMFDFFRVFLFFNLLSVFCGNSLDDLYSSDDISFMVLICS